jgi:hypothetical protein
MDPQELSDRLRGLYYELHRLANPPYDMPSGGVKREIRSIRDQIRSLGEEVTSDPNWLKRG